MLSIDYLRQPENINVFYHYKYLKYRIQKKLLMSVGLLPQF